MTQQPTPPHAAPEPADLRAAMSRFATGVTVMTAAVDDVPHGMTANAVSSVSLDPLLVLVCVERTTVMAERVVEAGAYALNVLNDDQRDLSNRFADGSRPAGHEQFEGVEVSRAPTGSPLLQDTLAWLDCTVWATYDGGDHLIVVGEVVALRTGPARDPLLYFQGGYTTLAD